MDQRLVNQLIKHEGLKLKPYRDTVGKLTIGVGRNLDDLGITEHEAKILLCNDIERVQEECRRTFDDLFRLDNARKQVIFNMAFNMGVPKLKKFKLMWKAIEEEDWKEAAAQMLESKWAEQVGGRARELAKQMETGQWGDDYV